MACPVIRRRYPLPPRPVEHGRTHGFPAGPDHPPDAAQAPQHGPAAAAVHDAPIWMIGSWTTSRPATATRASTEA
jgi:hypothetical protein